MPVSTYLEICQSVVRRAGISGGTSAKPATVLNQVGEMALIVDLVAEASREVETTWNDWQFMRVEVDFAIAADTQFFDPASVHSDVERLNPNTFTVRNATERKEVRCRHYEDFVTQRVLARDDGTALPSEVSIDRQGRVHFIPVCTREFVFRAECVLGPKTLAADSDTPLIPAGYRDVVLYKALMMYYEHADMFEARAGAEVRFAEWMERLEDKYLPDNQGGRTQTAENPYVVQVI